MHKPIAEEQVKLANYLKSLPEEERKKKLLAMISYLQTEAQERKDG